MPGSDKQPSWPSSREKDFLEILGLIKQKAPSLALMTTSLIFFPICGAAKPTPSVFIMVFAMAETRLLNLREPTLSKSIATDFFLKIGLGLVSIFKIGMWIF